MSDRAIFSIIIVVIIGIFWGILIDTTQKQNEKVCVSAFSYAKTASDSLNVIRANRRCAGVMK